MTREAYDELVARSPQGCLFCFSWWLDAVAGEAWRPNALEADGAVVAAWPTVVRKSSFGELHVGAPLTPFLGPLLSPPAGANEIRRRATEIKQLELLLGLIEPCAHIEARCNPAFDYWTPLSWHGFSQTTRYTWRLPDLGDLDAVFRGLRENVRREIRKARKQGIIVAEGTLADLEAVHDETVRRQGLAASAPANRAALSRIEAAAAPRGARTILVARDAAGRVHASGYFVHDERYVYYLLGASHGEYRTSGSPSLLMWRALELAAGRGLAFDFEGSMVRGVERFFRSFGGVPTPYSVVRKTASRSLRVATALKRAVRSAV
jgi:hypothetical protein